MDSRLPLGLNTGTVFVPSIFIFVYIMFQYFRTSKSKLSSLPTVGTADQSCLKYDIIDAHSIYSDTPYLIADIPNRPKTVVLPVRYLDEIKSLPESIVSFDDFVARKLHGKHSTIGSKNEPFVRSIKVDLTRNIANTLGPLQEEADLALPDCIGDCHDWTPVQTYSKMLRVVALLSGRVFVGLPLSRNEEWIESTINYTLTAFSCVASIAKLHPLTRDLFAPLLPEVQRVRQYRTRCAELLTPVLKERRERMKDSDFEVPTDMIQFLIQNNPEKADDALYQSHSHLIASVAAIHTTTAALTHALFDLALHPECIAPLREELEEVLAAENGTLVKTSMTKLRKMDSFLKESQRMNPNSSISMGRLVTSDLTLSDGLHLPKGTCIGIASIAIYRDSSIYPSPNEFQPWRFSDLRSLPENSNKYQLVTTGKDSLGFGHGTHACPGRFFASNEMKVILAGLITKYDIKFEDGKGRPENMDKKTVIVPNAVAEVLFRKRGIV